MKNKILISKRIKVKMTEIKKEDTLSYPKINF